jgi:hypothetical protein
MKSKDILAELVSNPKAIFRNANNEAGKYSEYPAYFQVVGMAHDKSYARVKKIRIHTEWAVLDEDGKWVKGEDGRYLDDTRPVAERTRIIYGDIESMPLRLILKTDKTEESMLADAIAREERSEREKQERIARDERNHQNLEELKTALVAVGLMKQEDADRMGRWGYMSLDLHDEKIPLLTSLLKSALAEVGV